MKTAFVLLSLATLAAAQKLEVSSQDQQIWLVRQDGTRERLTDGPSYKSAPAWSPDRARMAYFRFCPKRTCPFDLVVAGPDGKEMSAFPVVSPRRKAVCASVTEIDWIAPTRLGVGCHGNPSFTEYIEVDLTSGRSIRAWLGFGFAWSPDGTKLAYAGWVPHFTEPPAHSHYLRIGASTVYPPDAVREIPREPNPDEPPSSYTVPRRGGIYRGIHEFRPPFAWSPDSRWVAVLDRVYDWQPVAGANEKGERNVRFSVVVVSPDGKWFARALPKPPEGEAKLHWTGAQTLQIAADNMTARLAIGPAGLAAVTEPARGER